MEVTEEPAKQLKIDVVEDEPITSKKYDQLGEKEEKEIEPELPKHTKPEPQDNELKTQEGNIIHYIISIDNRFFY